MLYVDYVLFLNQNYIIQAKSDRRWRHVKYDNQVNNRVSSQTITLTSAKKSSRKRIHRAQTPLYRIVFIQQTCLQNCKTQLVKHSHSSFAKRTNIEIEQPANNPFNLVWLSGCTGVRIELGPQAGRPGFVAWSHRSCDGNAQFQAQTLSSHLYQHFKSANPAV